MGKLLELAEAPPPRSMGDEECEVSSLKHTTFGNRNPSTLVLFTRPLQALTLKTPPGPPGPSGTTPGYGGATL